MQRRSAFAERASAIADAAASWRNADFPPRVRAQTRIVERTAYSLPVVEYALDALFGSITAHDIESTIASEIGERLVQPIGRVAIISSRTTIGVAVVPAIFALCAGCDVVVKDREDSLVAAFFETLAQERDDFATAARAMQWEGESGTHDLSSYDAVVAFGGYDALDAIQASLAPGARFIPYAPKASIGYVAREALGDDAAAQRIATGAARDMLLYDGEGCLSLHALFVECGGNVAPEDFMCILDAAVQRAAVEFPIGRRDPLRAIHVAALRDLAPFRGGPIYFDAEATYMLETGQPERAPDFAPRVLAIHPVDSPREMRAYVERHRLPIEVCAVAGERSDVFDAAFACDANGIVAFGEMQNPRLRYPHGGRPRFADFVR
jgi:hypothetical protein